MQNHLSYEILNLSDIQRIYQNHILFCKKKASDYVSKAPLVYSDQEKSIFLKKLYSFFLLCSKYNISDEEILSELENIQTIQDIDTLILTVKNKLHPKKIQEEKILLKGEIERFIHNYHSHPFFQNRQRIYIKINKIPTLLSFIQESVDFFNAHLFDNQQIKLILKKQNITQKAQQGRVRENIHYKYFISDEPNKEIKIGKFLNRLYQEIIHLSSFMDKLSEQELDEFMSFFKNQESLSSSLKKEVSCFIKNKKEKNIHLSPTLFSLLKKSILTKTKDTKSYLLFISDFLLITKTKIHEMQIKSLEEIQNAQNEGDIILLSTHPRDIARMSEYTDWETCMSYDNEYAYDLPFQIGCGSIVAYLINSKNPYKKLSRVLLKPYAMEEEIKKLENRLNIFYQGENKKTLKNIELSIISNTNLKKIRNELEAFFNKTKEDLPYTEPNIGPRVYLTDKQFGLQNPLFLNYLNHINKKYLSITRPEGAFFAFGNYYRENLNKQYFFSNPNNPLHLMNFLEMNKSPYKITYQNNQPYLFTKSIYSKGIYNLNLSGVYSDYITMESQDLKFIDNRGLKTKVLTLLNLSNTDPFPTTLHISEKLIIHGKNLTILPKYIQTQELDINAPQLQFIPEELNVKSLSIINTNVHELPRLKLEVLSATYSKIKDLRNVDVSEFLDLTSTPIQFLKDNLTVSYLILNNCKNLKQLPTSLNVKGLDISNTNLLNIPTTHYKWLLMNNHVGLEKLPTNVSFDILEAQNSSLKELPKNISASRINISKSKVSCLPTNLKTHELDISQTAIETLPTDIQVYDLKAKKTKISVLPSDIKIKRIDLRESPLETVHYSKYLHHLTLTKLPQFIHPQLSPFIFVGFDEKDILKSKKLYIEKYMSPCKITEKNILISHHMHKNIYSHIKS